MLNNNPKAKEEVQNRITTEKCDLKAVTSSQEMMADEPQTCGRYT